MTAPSAGVPQDEALGGPVEAGEADGLALLRRRLEDTISEHSGHGFSGTMRPADVGCETYVMAWQMLALLPDGTPIAAKEDLAERERIAGLVEYRACWKSDAAMLKDYARTTNYDDEHLAMFWELVGAAATQMPNRIYWVETRKVTKWDTDLDAAAIARTAGDEQ